MSRSALHGALTGVFPCMRHFRPERRGRQKLLAIHIDATVRCATVASRSWFIAACQNSPVSARRSCMAARRQRQQTSKPSRLFAPFGYPPLAAAVGAAYLPPGVSHIAPSALGPPVLHQHHSPPTALVVATFVSRKGTAGAARRRWLAAGRLRVFYQTPLLGNADVAARPRSARHRSFSARQIPIWRALCCPCTFRKRSVPIRRFLISEAARPMLNRGWR